MDLQQPPYDLGCGYFNSSFRTKDAVTHSVASYEQGTLELNLPLTFELQVKQLHRTDSRLLPA
jgi:hypothetical protein